MKKTIGIILAGFLTISSASAADIFYERKEKLWTVFGIANDGDKNPACIAQQSWKDDSLMQVIKDLADSELYIFLKNMEWQISDDPGTYRLRVNAYVENEIFGFTFDYNLVPKNSITIRGIMEDKFIPVFARAKELRFIMPGTITNATIKLDGSSRAIDFIVECMEKFKSSGFTKSGKKGLNL